MILDDAFLFLIATEVRGCVDDWIDQVRHLLPGVSVCSFFVEGPGRLSGRQGLLSFAAHHETVQVLHGPLSDHALIHCPLSLWSDLRDALLLVHVEWIPRELVPVGVV